MLSICVVTQQYARPVSGVGLHAQLLATRLVRDGHKVTVLAPFDQHPTESLPISFIKIKRPLWAESQARWITLSWYFARVLEVLGDYYDIIHFTDAREALFCRTHYMHSVGNVNDTYAAELKNPAYYRQFYIDWLSRWFYYWIVQALEKKLFPRLRALIANSQYTAQVLRTQYPIQSEQLWVCYKAIDLNRYTPIAKMHKHRSHGIPKRILFVGSNMQRKGLPVLIRAAPYILSSLPSVEFWVVGQDRFIPKMKSLCQSLGVERAFRFWGWKSGNELLEIYGQADVFTMPSLTEALGVAFLEAMACGLPVVGTSVGGVPEIIENGYSGLLVEAGNAQQLAEALIQVLTDDGLRKQLIEGGFNKVLQFNVDRMMNCTYNVYKNILNIHRF